MDDDGISIAGWWYQTVFYFPQYMGSSFPLTFIFFRMVKTTNQYIYSTICLFNIANWKDPALLRTVNHLFLWAIYTMAMLVITRGYMCTCTCVCLCVGLRVMHHHFLCGFQPLVFHHPGLLCGDGKKKLLDGPMSLWHMMLAAKAFKCWCLKIILNHRETLWLPILWHMHVHLLYKAAMDPRSVKQVGLKSAWKHTSL